MNDREVARILQQRIGVAGFTAHGLRSGYVTQARIMGKANHEIRRVTGHASDDMIDVYDHHVNLIAQGPGNVVGATFGGGRLVDSEAGAGRRLVPDGRPTRRHRGVL
jgi:hypothetical protein